jgi:hypothetical protein
LEGVGEEVGGLDVGVGGDRDDGGGEPAPVGGGHGDATAS